MKLSEYKITTATPSVAGGRVVFDVANVGKVKHQFTIIRTQKSAATVLSAANPDDDIPARGARSRRSRPARPRSSSSASSSRATTPWSARFPWHYQAGMHADFTVR